ncbi:hypothetical protein [Pseudomonas sp. NA-150]|uniref:hypothetical protein n=1 Tax=Pseudomonas sp. NA-150 TaxID=3367525 RepID=UPI0037C56136
MSELIDELTIFTDYLTAYLSALSPIEKKNPVSRLSGLAPPPDLIPAYPTSPPTDCYKLLKHYQQRLTFMSMMLDIAAPGYDNLRIAVSQALPRVYDFMSFHLQTVRAQNPRPAQLAAAQQLEANARHRYRSGMGALANFLTQYQRIRALVSDENHQIGQMHELATLAKLRTHISLMMIGLNQAQRFCKEIVALRTRQ